jgi:hypothetical protein
VKCDRADSATRTRRGVERRAGLLQRAVMPERARLRRSGVTGLPGYNLDGAMGSNRHCIPSDRSSALPAIRSAPKLMRLRSPASRVQCIDQLLGYKQLISWLFGKPPRKARPSLGGLSGFPKRNRLESREITSGSPEQAWIVLKVAEPCVAMHTQEAAYLAGIMTMVLR